MSLLRPSPSLSFVALLTLGAAAPAAFAAFAVAGCAGHSATTEGIDAESAAIVVDAQDTDDHEQTTELGLEEPLSGAATAGGEVDVTLDAPAAAAAAKTNPGVFFQPAGCLTSTVAGNVVTHVFNDCTGPDGLVHLTGTVTSTWSKIPNGVEVVHQTTGFHIDGATVDHTVTIDYTRAAGVYTKTRHGTSSGTTAKGRAIAHQADYVTTYDPTSRCLTRNGASQTTIGGAQLSRTIEGYVRCGIGLGGCPKGGKYVLKRNARSIELDFPGGALVDIKINGGPAIERPLLCRPLA
jgi:hypothetical protein